MTKNANLIRFCKALAISSTFCGGEVDVDAFRETFVDGETDAGKKGRLEWLIYEGALDDADAYDLLCSADTSPDQASFLLQELIVHRDDAGRATGEILRVLELAFDKAYEHASPSSQQEKKADRIKSEYLESACHASDVDHAIAALMAGCRDLFESDRHAWSFLMEEPHEELLQA